MTQVKVGKVDIIRELSPGIDTNEYTYFPENKT